MGFKSATRNERKERIREKSYDILCRTNFFIFYPGEKANNLIFFHTGI